MASVILDDRDPLIVYSSGWHTGGLSTEYNSTTMYTDSEGATATLTFHGISIAVYGTIGSSNSNKTAPQSQYQLDGNKLVTYQPTLAQLSQRNQKFYQSPQLPKDQHTLVVTNTINGSSLLALDYLVILTGDTVSSSSSGLSPTGAVDSPTKETASFGRHVPVIAGSVGGVVGCALLVLGIAYFWRRRTRKQKEELNSTSVWMDSPPTTYRPSRPTKFTSSSSPSATPLPPQRTPLSSSIPSTSNHASSSMTELDIPPPDYKP